MWEIFGWYNWCVFAERATRSFCAQKERKKHQRDCVDKRFQSKILAANEKTHEYRRLLQLKNNSCSTLFLFQYIVMDLIL